MAEIAAIEVGDGVNFRPEQLNTYLIREQDVYAAVRVAMPASVATATLALKVDVNVGDPVTPAPVEVSYPALLDEPFTMVGYPLATMLAEKLVTMIARGDTTTESATSLTCGCSQVGTRSPSVPCGRRWPRPPVTGMWRWCDSAGSCRSWQPPVRMAGVATSPEPASTLTSPPSWRR